MSNSKYVKVLFGTSSYASGKKYDYKINELNVADNWNINAKDHKEIGGFCFGTEDTILRWLIRGDTIYDVEIPEGAEVIETNSKSAPGGTFKTNKIILKNPKVITDDDAMRLYKMSNLPEKSYFVSIAICAIRDFYKTAMKIIIDKVTLENVDEVVNTIKEFTGPEIEKRKDKTKTTYDEVMWTLMKIQLKKKFEKE